MVPSKRQEDHAGKGVWWEFCTNTGHAVYDWCSVSRAANSVSFTCTGSLGGGNQRSIGGLSTQRQAAGRTSPAALPLLLQRSVSFCLSATRNACVWGLPACSLAMMMGFMTPLLAPEDRCEKRGGGGGGGGGRSGGGVS